jgi:hypothetical protein
VLQNTDEALTLQTRLTAVFALGNSSGVRKRVTVLLHDGDFGDLSACTFWLEPGQPLAPHTMRSYTTKAWSNATLSVYVATVDASQWILLDDVTFRVTPGAQTAGTDCIEPSGSSNVGGPGFVRGGAVRVSPADVDLARRGDPARPADAVETAVRSVAIARPFDLRHAASAALQFDSVLSNGLAGAFVEVTRDGRHWIRIAAVPPSDEWTRMAVDLRDYLGDIVYVRFVVEDDTSGGGPIARWWIQSVSVRQR